MSIEREVREFLEVVGELGTILRDEIVSVRAMRIDAIRALQEPKARLAGAYDDACAKLAGRSEGLRGLTPKLRAELRHTHDELKELVTENARLLMGAREVNERLIRMLADAVARQASGPANRYAPGRAKGGTERRPASVPLAFDRRA